MQLLLLHLLVNLDVDDQPVKQQLPRTNMYCILSDLHKVDIATHVNQKFVIKLTAQESCSREQRKLH